MLAALPAPSAPLPHSPGAFAAALRQDERSLAVAIDRWDARTPPPRDVVLLALFRQRSIRALAERPALARQVERKLPSVTADVQARAALTRLSVGTPPPPSPPHIGAPAPAASLLAWYRAAARRFHLRWQLLAAVNFVESAFGKVRNVSGAGAQGPMQFEPATWRAYGLGGDIHDPHDAILGAANYLAANSGARDERNALFHYNHSQLYVDAVVLYANRMARDAHAFLEYYSWQVYFRTAHGYSRLTGPR